MKKIKESVRKILREEYKKLTEEEWDDLWLKLRRFNSYKGFNEPGGGWYTFGGLFFFLNEKNGYLELPPQKLSDWRRDPQKATEILDNYVNELKNIFKNSDLNLTLEVGPNYSMKIQKS
jgi:hypothetical protein